MRSRENKKIPLDISMGMHINSAPTRSVYFVIQSIIALLGSFGTIFTFTTALETRGLIFADITHLLVTIVISWAVFSLIFAFNENYRRLSKILLSVAAALLLIFFIAEHQKIIGGIMLISNDILDELLGSSAFDAEKYNLLYLLDKAQAKDTALCFAAVLICLLTSHNVKKPNILLFIIATFPLAEVSLYFGLVPSYFAFGTLMVAWCGAAAAEMTQFVFFSDSAANRIFTKNASQAAAAAAVIMALCFCAAGIYTQAIDFERPESVNSFRLNAANYINNFSWERLRDDISDTVSFDNKNNLTHDGKLGNVDSVEFTGKNMLEVTLPADTRSIYLKGFSGINYTGSRWNEGMAMPSLETKMTSQEFFVGRAICRLPEFTQMQAKNVIIRNTGVSQSVKYFPENSVGLLETDGTRRRYAVYYPSEVEIDWRDTVLSYSDNSYLPEAMANDESKMSLYAYNYCLDVPPTFTAAEEFFDGYTGNSREAVLDYIRKKLADECSYSLDTGRKPFGSDFAQWFLTENKIGSCTHFASSAVLLCRYMGIPARYCEGFIIKQEDISSYTPDENGYVTVTVPDNRGHAWAEIYAHGVGWIVFESTPGYGNVAAVPMSNSYENAITSELTDVTTEAPQFSENIGSITTQTNISAEETTFGSTEITAVVTTEQSTAAVESAVTTFVTAQGGNSNNSYSTSEEQLTDTDSQSDTQITADENLTALPVRKPLPKSVKILLICVVSIAFLTAAYMLIRRVIFVRRRKMIKSRPEKAAVQIYQKLIDTAAKAEIDISVCEKIPELMAKRLDIDEADVNMIVICALKSRFGGGITENDAKKAAECYDNIMKKLITDMNGGEVIFLKLALNDTYRGNF